MSKKFHLFHCGHLEDGRHDEGEGKDEEERHDESEQEGQVVAADEFVIFINFIFENSFLKNSINNFFPQMFSFLIRWTPPGLSET